MDQPVDLQELAGLWNQLPEAIRDALLRTARAIAGMRDSSIPIERTHGKEGEETCR